MSNRAQDSNIFLFIDPNRDTIQGGFRAGPACTQRDLFAILACLVRPADSWTLHTYNTDEHVIEDDSRLDHGSYIIKPIRKDGESQI